jgi:hypothetical protein
MREAKQTAKIKHEKGNVEEECECEACFVHILQFHLAWPQGKDST